MAAAAAEMGAALVQVQEDLQKLKDKLRNVSQEWEEVDLQGLEAAIERTESGLRKHTEKYLSTINKSVLTISSSGDAELHLRQISKWGIPLETSQKEIIFPEAAAIPTQRDEPSLHISSGSKHKLSMTMKILCNPRNDQHRSVLNQNYGVSLPLINRRETAPAPTQKVAKGVTVGNLSVAPPPHCRIKLPLSKVGAEKGILNLIERGLIPRAARITLEKSPVLLRSVPLHEFCTKHKKPAAEGGVGSKKVDQRPHPFPKSASTPSYTSKGSIAPPPSCISVISPKKSRQQLIPAISKQEFAASAWLPKTPKTLSAQSFENPALDLDIPIRQGVLDHETSSLLAFKQHCCLCWGSALSFLEHVANLLKDFAVPSAIIKGKKVMEILPDFELTQRPTKEELLSVIKNCSTVKRLISQPGQRYKGQNGVEAAATKIQATWRCFQCRRAYITFRQQQWASGVIALSWLVHVHMGRVRKILKESRQRHLENFFTRAKHLAANWNRIRTSRRTIIHIPSLGRTLLSVDLSATSITHHIMTP